MTWTTLSNRGAVLRRVVERADQRRDGLLPLDVEGVDHVFEDANALLSALLMRWNTQLAIEIERGQQSEAEDPETLVLDAWTRTAKGMPGTRLVIDHYRREPSDDVMARMVNQARLKEWEMLAVAAGLSHADPAATQVHGARIEEAARARHDGAAVGINWTSLSPLGRSVMGRLNSTFAA